MLSKLCRKVFAQSSYLHKLPISTSHRVDIIPEIQRTGCKSKFTAGGILSQGNASSVPTHGALISMDRPSFFNIYYQEAKASPLWQYVTMIDINIIWVSIFG